MRTGLALGGGIGYGFAHIGVLKVLEKNGIKPAIITGTSVGALIGALYACGMKAGDIEKLALEFKWHEVLKLTIPKEGLVSLDGLEDFVHKHTGCDRVENLKVKFAAVATDLINGKKVIFTEGDLGKVVRASCSLPGIFTPSYYRDSMYVDGGLVDNVPVDAAKKLGAEFVIGVDVIAKADFHLILKRDIVNVMWKSLQLMIQQNSNRSGEDAPDIMLMPDIAGTNPFDLLHAERLIRMGELAAESSLDQMKEGIKAADSGSIGNKIGKLFKRD